MKIQAKALYGIATLALSLFLAVCFFLAVTDRVAVTYADGRVAAARDLSPEGLFFQEKPTPGHRADSRGERPPSAVVQGLVIDGRTRQPIVGARVSLERGRVEVNSNARSKESGSNALTSERGRFRFERIVPGVYRLMATKPGYVPSSFHVTELEAGKTTPLEIPLDPLVKFSGRVLDQSNNAVREARVRVLFDSRQPSAALRRLLSEQGDSVLMTTTWRQGEFDLFVPADQETVSLAALALGYAPSKLGPFPVRAGRARTGILLRLSRGLEAHGRVVDEDGTPINSAAILAHRSGSGEAEAGLKDMEPRATSGVDGRFVLRGLEAWSYELKVSHVSHATATVAAVEIQSQTANRLPDIVLLPEAQIKGRVADAEGQPIPGAKISGLSGEVNSSEVISDDKGTFVLGGFAPGASVVLSATAAGHSAANKVARAPDRDVIMVLPRHSALRGRVEDAETLTPVKEFQIRVAYGAEGKSFRSQDGTFELKDLPPGQWAFVTQAPGYQTMEVAGIEIRAGEPTEGVVFSLARGVELSGRVVDAATGAGLPNVTVGYRVATGVEIPPWASRFGGNGQVTDSDGNFKFDGLPLGKVMIIAESPLHAETRRTVVAGEEKFVEIRLPKGGSVSGRVVGSDSITPLPGARVSLWTVASMSAVTIPADEAGGFSFNGLAEERYRLIAEGNLGQTKPREIVLRESERLMGLVLAVKAGATIRGRVTGLGPDELPVIEIVAQGQGDFTVTASTAPDGTYAIHGAPEGWVEVIAQTSSQRSVSKSVEIPQGALELSLNIEFPRVARLSGQVTRGGKPVVYRIVNASSRDPESAAGSGKTDQNGMYAIDGLSEGDYVVSLSGAGARSLRISGDTVLDIELPALSLSGRVLEVNSGQPLSSVTVQVQPFSQAVDAGSSRTAITDSLGRFSVEGTEPGQYQLLAHKGGFKVGTETLSVPASSELVISLTPAEGITIRVRDGISGLALRAVTVQAFSGAQPMRLNVALDETGSGELPQLAPGRYHLLVSCQGYAPKPVIGWTVPSSPLDLFLTPGGRLEIQVDSAHTGVKASFVDGNGVPPQLERPEFALLQPTVFPHLSPGEYVLLVKLREQTKTYKASISEGQTTVLQVK